MDEETQGLKTRALGDDFEGKAEPGAPLDELEPSPPEFQRATQGARQETKAEPGAHPTSALSSTPRHKPGPIRPSGAHPTAALHVKPRR